MYTQIFVKNYKHLVEIGYDAQGKRFQTTTDFKPDLYLRNDTNNDTSYISSDGVPLKKLTKTIPNFYDFIQEYNDRLSIYGNIDPIYQYIYKHYGQQKDFYNLKNIRTFYIDIEIYSNDGKFPDPSEADHEINAITIKDSRTKKIYTFGLKPYEIASTVLEKEFNDIDIKFDKKDVCYKHCEDEEQLLEYVVKMFQKLKPDVITGWNSKLFDMPYLTNRINNILGISYVRKMSPINSAKAKTHYVNKKEIDYFDINITNLDYIDLYKKFTYITRESYTLDFISETELGARKVKFDGTLNDLYDDNNQLFIDYNIKDVELVYQLNEKMQLIELAFTLAYETGITFDDVFGTLVVWDVLMYNKLKKQNKEIIPKKKNSIKIPYPGAFVKQPKIGKHENLTMFDLNSLYPNLAIGHNMSTETKVEYDDIPQEIKDNILSKFESSVEYETPTIKKSFWNKIKGFINRFIKRRVYDKDIKDSNWVFNHFNKLVLNDKIDLSLLKKHDLSMTPNLKFWRRNKQGIIGEAMEEKYNLRVATRKLMFDEKDKKLLVSFHLKQMALKILINSGYGAFANNYFRYFDIDVAEGITTSGQLTIKYVEQEVVKRLKGMVYSVYCDTDSVFFSCTNMINKIKKKYPNKEFTKKQTVQLVEKYSKEKIEPMIKTVLDELQDKLNYYKNTMVMGNELIGDVGIWVKKKKYVVRKWIEDGYWLDKPELKVTGIEIVRSSTPQVVRTKLKEILWDLFDNDKDYLIKDLKEYKKEFFNMSVDKISFPRSVNNLEKYQDDEKIYGLRTPIHVRGSLLHNWYINKHDMDYVIPIYSADKIKFIYLKVPNVMNNENVFSFKGEFLDYFKLSEYIDYQVQFEKAMLTPVNILTTAIGYDIVEEMKFKKVDISDMFG